jgi:hypothetical protein
MKDNVRDFQKNVRRKFASQIEGIYAKRSGEFSNEAIVQEVANLFDEQNINELRHIIARKVVESEDSARCGTSIPATIDMFDESIVDSTLIALGDGTRVKLRDATKLHILRKIENIRDRRRALDGSEEKWLNALASVEHLLDADAKATFYSCLRQLGIIKAAA